MPVKNDHRQRVGRVFSRSHQLAATHQVLASVRTDGSGRQCLLQHSAGSGKTNSIAWAAHFLADLHDAEHRKVIHSVSVTSDRTVLDSPLCEALTAFARTQGVVAIFSVDGASNSRELTEVLTADRKIVVRRLQTFPFRA